MSLPVKLVLALVAAWSGLASAQTRVAIDSPATEHVLTVAHPDEYSAELKAGDYYLVTAFQESVDLVLEVYGPDGKLLDSIDTPNGSFGPEEWDRIAPATGLYRFVIRQLDKTARPGKYTMAIRSSVGYAKIWIREQVWSLKLQKLWTELTTDRSAADRFLTERMGKGPIVEPLNKDSRLVTFIYKAPPATQTVWLNGGPSPDNRSPMQPIGDSGLWFFTAVVPKDSRFRYSFESTIQVKAGATAFPMTQSSLDPLNPARTATGESMFALEGAPKQPYSAPPAKGAPRGQVTRLSMASRILKQKRTFSVYTPPGFDPTKRGSYSVTLIFDGEEYGSVPPPRSYIDTRTIMDNAIGAHKLKPMIVVLVDSMGNRGRDLACYRPFADFVAKELLPEVRRRYPAATKSASRVIVAGSSLGGVCASYCGLTHSESIGNVLSQSGAYWIPGTDMNSDPYGLIGEEFIPNAYVKAKHLPLRFYMEVGIYESTANQLRTNRELRDVLQAKGYDVTYREFSGNHDYEVWRGSLVTGLTCLTRDWR